MRKRKRPCVKAGLCCLAGGRLQLEGGWGAPCWPPREDSCSQHFGLRRLPVSWSGMEAPFSAFTTPF